MRARAKPALHSQSGPGQARASTATHLPAMSSGGCCRRAASHAAPPCAPPAAAAASHHARLRGAAQRGGGWWENCDKGLLEGRQMAGRRSRATQQVRAGLARQAGLTLCGRHGWARRSCSGWVQGHGCGTQRQQHAGQPQVCKGRGHRRGASVCIGRLPVGRQMENTEIVDATAAQGGGELRRRGTELPPAVYRARRLLRARPSTT
mgnify:CR=1 FL=1